MGKLEEAIFEINKKFKDTIVKQGVERDVREKIPFSSPRLNYMVYGGLPLGIAVEFFGPENGGKTTTALDVVKNAQIYSVKEYNRKLEELETQIEKTGKDKKLKELQLSLSELVENGPRKVLYIDAENTLSEEWARTNGVDIDNLILARPLHQTAEQVLQIILDMIDTGQIILVVLDSIPMLVSQQLYEEDMSKKAYAGVSAPLSMFAARVAPKLNEQQTLLIMINQVRENINNPYATDSTPGGRAVKHLYAVRLMFRRGSFIDDKGEELNQKAENPAGNLVNVLVHKTKVFRPDRRQGFYTLNYTTGIDKVADLVDLAIKEGVIDRAGAWFSVENDNGEEVKFQGKLKLIEYLRDNVYLADKIEDKLSGL